MFSSSLLIMAAAAVASFDAPVILPPPPSHAVPAANLLRVVTWNIDRGTEFDQIVEMLQRNPADLILLQEVDCGAARSSHRDEARELAARLQLAGAYGIEFEELSQEKDGHPAYIGQATLTSLPVRSSRVLRFRNQSGFWKPRSWIPSKLPLMQRRAGGRIALITELSFAGKLLVVYNAHLESRSYGRIQARQLDEMLSDVAAHYGAETPVILAGDLNTKYIPSWFLHKLQRAGFQSALGNRIERTHRIAMALDWIFAKEPLSVREGKVRKDVKGSDHYAIYATIGAQ